MLFLWWRVLKWALNISNINWVCLWEMQIILKWNLMEGQPSASYIISSIYQKCHVGDHVRLSKRGGLTVAENTLQLNLFREDAWGWLAKSNIYIKDHRSLRKCIVIYIKDMLLTTVWKNLMPSNKGWICCLLISSRDESELASSCRERLQTSPNGI